MTRLWLWFKLAVVFVLCLHIGFVILTTMPDKKHKGAESIEILGFEPGAPVQLSQDELTSFALAFGFKPQEVTTSAKLAEQTLSEMSPKLIAVSKSDIESVALISTKQGEKSVLLRMRVGEKQYGYELKSLESTKAELASTDKALVLYLFKYMESPAPSGV